ncbi:MAG TPA: glutaredoxin family protein, partial [Methylophaga sp.]|nr:glutaredoxin family protein [Methylophaga sp.]
MIQLQLFSTAGCHLCELAVEQVHNLPAADNIQLQIIEIGD